MAHWHWRFSRRLLRMIFHGAVSDVGGLDLPRTDIPCYQLPVCTGHQYPAQLLLPVSAEQVRQVCLVKGSNYLESTLTDKDRCI